MGFHFLFSFNGQISATFLWCFPNFGFHVFIVFLKAVGSDEPRAHHLSAEVPVLTMALWHADDLAKEIADMEVISMRNRGSELLPRMKDSLKSKVNGIQNLSPSSFVKLCDAIGKSTLPPEIKKELEDCLEAKAASSIQGPAKLQTMPQSMTMPFNYLSQSEWQQLQSGFNKVEATTLVCRRVKLCGLKSMKEDTKKHIAAFLVCLQMNAGSPMLSKPEMYKLANDVHATFNACQVQPLHPGLAKYPPSPYDIGQALGS